MVVFIFREVINLEIKLIYIFNVRSVLEYCSGNWKKCYPFKNSQTLFLHIVCDIAGRNVILLNT